RARKILFPQSGRGARRAERNRLRDRVPGVDPSICLKVPAERPPSGVGGNAELSEEIRNRDRAFGGRDRHRSLHRQSLHQRQAGDAAGARRRRPVIRPAQIRCGQTGSRQARDRQARGQGGRRRDRRHPR
ncbi:hypothetical protein KXV85_005749, partial [Aspergillus fumigatus]